MPVSKKKYNELNKMYENLWCMHVELQNRNDELETHCKNSDDHFVKMHKELKQTKEELAQTQEDLAEAIMLASEVLCKYEKLKDEVDNAKTYVVAFDSINEPLIREIKEDVVDNG